MCLILVWLLTSPSDTITSHVRQSGKNHAVIWWYNTETGKLHYSRPCIGGIKELLEEVLKKGHTRSSYKGYRFRRGKMKRTAAYILTVLAMFGLLTACSPAAPEPTDTSTPEVTEPADTSLPEETEPQETQTPEPEETPSV